MLRLSVDHWVSQGPPVYILTDDVGVEAYHSGDLGEVLDWLTDNNHKAFCLRTGTQLLKLTITRKRDQQRTVR